MKWRNLKMRIFTRMLAGRMSNATLFMKSAAPTGLGLPKVKTLGFGCSS
jgi:hypothetical protein